MTQIGFYVLEQGDANAALFLACRLAEKACQRGHRVYIHVPDANVQSRLDDMLWTFRADSFVPHARAVEDETAPVLIGGGEPPEGMDDVLINLAHEVPAFFSRFQRLAELVTPDREQRGLARTRYKFYQDRGYALETHKIR